MRILGGVGLAVVLVLAGCTGTAGPTTPPAATTPGPVRSVSPSASAPATEPAVVASMPAADGGPMLWPLLRSPQSDAGGDAGDEARYGFVDVHGKLVVPVRYDGYTACPDASGRTAIVLGFAAGKKVDILDLSGHLVRRTPTESADCGGPGRVIFTHVIDGELSLWNSGLMDVATGRVIVPLAKDRHLTVIDQDTVNVSDPSGEHFLDVPSGRRTPHPGWLYDTGYPGSGLVTVSEARTRADAGSGKFGRMDLSGHWVHRTFDDAVGPMNGFLLVQSGGRWTAVDAATGATLGGPWDEIETVDRSQTSVPDVVGFVATTGVDHLLLGPDLHEVVAPGPATITCDWAADGACSVVAADGSARLVLLPSGATSPMPAGFTRALSPSFLAADAPDDSDDELPEGDLTSRVYATASGTSVALAVPSRCSGVGTAWAECDADTGMVPPVVLDARGNRTPYRSVQAVADPSPSAGIAYYGVTAGDVQGFVDASGTWHYRESRFTQLED